MLHALPPGWLTLPEAECLAELATDAHVLEVGSFYGRSTVALASTARRVFAIDHHRGSVEHQPGGRAFVPTSTDQADRSLVDTAPAFLANLTIYGARDRVVPIVGHALEVLPFFAEGAFDLGFVDADHSEAATFEVGAAVLRAVGRGIVLFHDANELPVRIAVQRLAGATGRTVVAYAGSIVGLARNHGGSA